MNKESLLSFLYKEREFDILTLEKNDKKNLKELLKDRDIKNKQLEIAVNNIPNGFENIINNLEKAIQEKLEIENSINGYFSEKAYKEGFFDAIKCIMRCIDNENNNEHKRN
ncbi:MAG: hypothetical protein J6A89_01280 [Clostridia bacterium]|nr:hypothetical protein [Clostridia bacterium]